MRSDAAFTKPSSRACAIAALPLLLAAVAGCSSEPESVGPEPFVMPASAAESEAPFRGRFEAIGQFPAEASTGSPEMRREAGLGTPPALPAPAVAEIAAPPRSPALSDADRRREAWLGEPFRCKAVSSTRLRRCRFEQTENGYRLRFPMSDVTCEDVTFDHRGDPERLTGCRGAWLRVPASNRLRSDRARHVWSGSHSGWRWRGDGQPYCCPGLWLEAPQSIRTR